MGGVFSLPSNARLHPPARAVSAAIGIIELTADIKRELDRNFDIRLVAVTQRWSEAARDLFPFESGIKSVYGRSG